MLFALPTYAIQTFLYAYQLGWFPRFFVSAVSIEPTIMSIARLNTHGKETTARSASRSSTTRPARLKKTRPCASTGRS